MPVGNWHA